ncbi:hypothetical protein DES39_0549 [Orbus hercynius]|uniref:Uncharacterized protein n=1 Tax=Orbus hercynius TaxID=593135 RepID=A0A495RIZ0_9GAMM|nr:hypothetical protein [Orbus hercynius]RKS87329.1 hypothetical protein DES39_0549 [Orbus hercynius]
MKINVKAIANSLIQPINPDIPATIYKDLGGEYVEGVWQPKREILEVRIQRQQLTQNDILFLNNLEFQGNFIVVYVKGHYDGVNRIDKKSPDIFVFDDREYKVIHVPEQWPTWSRVILCEQEKSITG